MDATTTGTFLAALRKERGMTQQQVAEVLNLSNKTISKWESGAGLPDITVLPVLAELYSVTADELLAGARMQKGEDAVPSAALQRREYLLSRAELRFNILLVLILVAVALSRLGILSDLIALPVSAGLLAVDWLLMQHTYRSMEPEALLRTSSLRSWRKVFALAVLLMVSFRTAISLHLLWPLSEALGIHFLRWSPLVVTLLVLALWMLLQRALHHTAGGRLLPLPMAQTGTLAVTLAAEVSLWGAWNAERLAEREKLQSPHEIIRQAAQVNLAELQARYVPIMAAVAVAGMVVLAVLWLRRSRRGTGR